MKIDVLITSRLPLTIWIDLCDFLISHFFFYGILPDDISILVIDGNSLFDCLRQLEPKFMGPFKVSSTVSFQHGHYDVSFLHVVSNSPRLAHDLCPGLWNIWQPGLGATS